LDLTQGIFLFGTPHQGLQTDGLEAIADFDSGGQRKNLIMQLKQDSEYLENQTEDLIRIWTKFEGRKLFSFYATMKQSVITVENARSVPSARLELLLTSCS